MSMELLTGQQWSSSQCGISSNCPFHQGLWVGNLPERPEAGPRNIPRIISPLGADCLYLDSDRHDGIVSMSSHGYVLYHLRPSCSNIYRAIHGFYGATGGEEATWVRATDTACRTFYCRYRIRCVHEVRVPPDLCGHIKPSARCHHCNCDGCYYSCTAGHSVSFRWTRKERTRRR